MMRRYPFFLATGAFVLLSGCAGSGGCDEGLILRHLPLWYWEEHTSLTSDGEAYVIRDRSCWEQIVGSPENWLTGENTPEYEQTLDVDFDTEMVILYYEHGCGEHLAIDCVNQVGDQLEVTVSRISPYVSCAGYYTLLDAVVVPKSDVDVTGVLLPSLWYQPHITIPYPPRSVPTTRIDGPCEQTAP